MESLITTISCHHETPVFDVGPRIAAIGLLGVIPQVQQDIGWYDFPLTGAEMRCYANHTLSYDQARKSTEMGRRAPVTRETIRESRQKALRSSYTPVSQNPSLHTMQTTWAVAGPEATWPPQETTSPRRLIETVFYSRLEMYCRELAKRFDDMWLISGPLVLPEEGADGKKTVFYQFIGKDDVAVPTHFFKVILVRKDQSASGNFANNQSASETLALGPFIVPNRPIGFKRPLTDFQNMSGLTFFPKVEWTTLSLPNLCNKDFKEFTLYLTGRKVGSARTTVKLEKFMAELKE
ncbi:unnamed protein product [Coregonus sp. 'balchen']|nr:unnamed protein product [Coregonus sp. 'balchen']